MGRSKEAIEKFKKVIKLKPDVVRLLSRAYFFIGFEDEKLGKKDEAISNFNKVIELNVVPADIEIAKKYILKMKN